MSASHDIPDPSNDQRGRAFWLPPGGFGNGIGASAWAEIADLTEEELPKVLFALVESRIAGYVAIVQPKAVEAGNMQIVYRLWVDSLRYLQAEDVLMEVLRSRPGV
jgi:hypothetical protein